MTKLLKSANLDGYFTNHSLRRTSATRLFQAGVDQKIVKEITVHVSDAVNKYQVTSMKQKENVSKILKVSDNVQVKNTKREQVAEPIVPTLEFSISDNYRSDLGNNQCNCARKKFDVKNRDQLGAMINELLAKRKGGKAKIKLELEFSD